MYLKEILPINVYILHFSNGELIKEKADFVLGCDGAFSAVRRNMMKKGGFNFDYSQVLRIFVAEMIR